MILALDHIAWNVDGLDRYTTFLKVMGYRCLFMERSLPNMPEKKAFLKTYASTHDIALFQKDGSPNVELTCHGTPTSFISSYCLNNNGTIGAKVRDLKTELDFWTRHLGFKKISQTELSLNSFLPSGGCRLHFTRASDEGGYLDSEGYTCLAFLVKNIDKKISLLGSIAECSRVFRLDVNGRSLKLAIIRTPNRLLCEFIEI